MEGMMTEDYSENALYNPNIPQYNGFYSLQRVKENTRTVFSPQCLLNNPITDPYHSQYVHSYLQGTLYNGERITESESAMNNISVRTDLHIPTQEIVDNQLEYDVIDLSINEKRETIKEDKRCNNEYYSDHKHKIKSDRYLEPPSKKPKLLRVERQYSGLVEKIYDDCLMANKQDIHGN